MNWRKLPTFSAVMVFVLAGIGVPFVSGNEKVAVGVGKLVAVGKTVGLGVAGKRVGLGVMLGATGWLLQLTSKQIHKKNQRYFFIFPPDFIE
jgi:hypothetical protein